MFEGTGYLRVQGFKGYCSYKDAVFVKGTVCLRVLDRRGTVCLRVLDF